MFHDALGKDAEAVVIVGNGESATVQIRSETLNNDETAKLRTALFDKFQPKGEDGQPSAQAISDSAVSETWGGQITKKALIALLVFVVIVSIYIAVRYERYMAIAALATMFFDLIVTAGVYSLVGFEVTPATVIGLLTILGFSLYDTVIVFDKVEENTHGLRAHHPAHLRRTGEPGGQPDIHAVDQHQPDLGAAGAGADRGRGVAAGRGHAQGPGAGPAGRHHRRHLLVDLLRHAAAGDAARTHRVGGHPHPPGAQPARQGRRRLRHRGDRLRRRGRRRRGVRGFRDHRGRRCRPAWAPPSKPAPGARPARPTAGRTGRPTGKRNTRRG